MSGLERTQHDRAMARAGVGRRRQGRLSDAIVSRPAQAWVAVTVVVAAAVSAIVLFGAASPRPRSGPLLSKPHRYVDRAGWSVLYPTAFHVEVSNQELGLATVEVTVASFAERAGIVVRGYRRGGSVRAVPPLDRAGRFPPDGVAFRLVNQSGLPDHLFGDASTPVPLALRTFRPSGSDESLAYSAMTGETLRNGEYHGAPRSEARTIYSDGTPYTAVIWIEPRATRQRRDELAQVVASLRFQTPATVRRP